jgi:hypothetical protein
MRIPSLKSFLIFAAGFVSCVAGIVVFIFSLYHFWIKPMQARAYKYMNSTPPRFFSSSSGGIQLYRRGQGCGAIGFQSVSRTRGRPECLGNLVPARGIVQFWQAGGALFRR